MLVCIELAVLPGWCSASPMEILSEQPGEGEQEQDHAGEGDSRDHVAPHQRETDDADDQRADDDEEAKPQDLAVERTGWSTSAARRRRNRHAAPFIRGRRV